MLARNWFAWWMVQRELQIGGDERRIQLSHALGKTPLSNILSPSTGPRNVGDSVIERLAPELRMTPGQFKDQARSWWELTGRSVYAEEMKRRAREATIDTRESSDSGTMPAIAGPSTAPPPDRKAN